MSNYDRGKALYAQQQYSAALQAFSEAIDVKILIIKGNNGIGDDHPDRNSNVELHILYSNRCACHIQLQDNIGALSDAKRCVEHCPSNFVKGFLRLGSCYYNLKMTRDALNAYERALVAEPNNAEALKMVSLLKRGIGDGSDSSSSSSSNRYGGAGPPPPQANNASPYSNNNGIGSIGGLFSLVKNTVTRWVSQVYSFFYFIHPDEKPYYYAGAGLVIVLLFMWISRFLFEPALTATNYAEHIAVDPSHEDYIPPPPHMQNHHHRGTSSSGSFFGGGYGLPTSSLLLLMIAGYFVPPYIPHIVGPERARPFFGMSWMTFLWLVRLVFDRGGGFRGGGFAFGGGNRRRRGLFY